MAPYTRAVVRRGDGPLHIATLNRTSTSWSGLCGRRVPNNGTIAFEGEAALQASAEHSDEFCTECADFARKVAASLPTRIIVPKPLRPTGWAAR